MATVNKGLTQPAIDSAGWGLPINEDYAIIDDAFGGVTSISLTGVTSTPVDLTLAQYQNMTIKFTGTQTANVTYRLPAGVGGRWVVQKNTTSAFTVTISSLGGGASFLAPSDYTEFFSDGTNCVGNLGRMASGIIAIWSGSQASIPTGWLLCDGTNGTIDLRDKFVVGAGGTYAVGDTGGSATVALTNAQMPSHTHTVAGATGAAGVHAHNINDPSHSHNYDYPSFQFGGVTAGGGVGYNAQDTFSTAASGTGISIVAGGAHQHTISGNTSSIGSGTAHENRPPYYALCYISKI